MAALAVLVILLVAGGGSSSSGPAASIAGDGPASMFEAEAQMQADPAATIALLQRLGVGIVRVYLPWSAVAPNPKLHSAPVGFDPANPGSYPQKRWVRYDRIVIAARARGVTVDLTVGGPGPVWAQASSQPPGGPAGVWEPSAAEYGAFMTAVGKRYSGTYTPPGDPTPLPRIGFWAIWNEPNYGQDLAPQVVNHTPVEAAPLQYRSLLDAAWSALQSTGHGRDTILIGELAPRGVTLDPGNYSGMFPLRFLRALYCVDSSYQVLQGAAAAARGCPTSAAASKQFRSAHPALFAASGFATHPYPLGIPPNVPDPAEPDSADIATIGRLEGVLDRLQGTYASRTRLPIYSTEFGYQTDPPEKILRALPPATAAGYLNWAEYLTWRDPRIRTFDQYQLIDTARGGFATGLELLHGIPTALYYAYRMPIYLPLTSGARGQTLEVWGCVRPATYARSLAGQTQAVQIQFQPAAGGPFRTIRTIALTGPYGYFDVRQSFPSSGAVRLAWAYPHGQQVFSRAVGIALR